MTEDTHCTIRLLNKYYEIKCPNDEKEGLQRAALKLNEYVANKKNEFMKLNDFQALLLAALHISHELIRCEAQQKEQRAQLAKFISTFEKANLV